MLNTLYRCPRTIARHENGWPNQGVVTWSIFLPREQQRMRPSMYRGYKVLWHEIKPFFDGLWTRGARTPPRYSRS